MIVSGKARLAGVFGWPVGHSKSPRLHGFWLEKYGIDGAYLPLPVAPENFASVLRALPMMGFVGANVTIPHKETALRCVDRVEDTARRIGAVNTLVILPDGTVEGRNTDAFGFIENLRAGAPSWRGDQGPAVVLGAGGAARALCVALLDAGVSEIRLINRGLERAQALARDLGGPIHCFPWEQRSQQLSEAALLVNSTNLGMSGGPGPLDLDLSALPASALVNDIVYAPLETDLLRRAKGRGNLVVDGLGMLLHQARPGFAAWFGRDPEVTDDLRSFVLGG